MLSTLLITALAATSSSTDLSLVCRIEDWSPPPFVSSTEAARANLATADRQWLDQFEQALRDKSRARENGNIGVTEFDRFVEKSFNDAARARPELKPILESVSARYSRAIGVDRVLALNNERMLAEHEASKAAKPFLGKHVQFRHAKGVVTWQESLRKVVDKATLDAPDAQSGLVPSLASMEDTLVFSLAPVPGNPAMRTLATIDRYTGELLLEKTDANGKLLYSLSGTCDKQTAPRF